MTWPLLQLLTLVYLLVLVWMHRNQWTTFRYIWGALGFTFIILHMAALLDWHHALATMEARHIQRLMTLFGTNIDFVNDKILLVPDESGWIGLNITLECSTLLELSVFTGLLLFYPRLPTQQRFRYFVIGLLATYALNLMRIGIIIGLVMLEGREIVPIAHNIVARAFYFVGVITIYWFLLTRPTLYMIRRSVETQGMGVN